MKCKHTRPYWNVLRKQAGLFELYLKILRKQVWAIWTVLKDSK